MNRLKVEILMLRYQLPLNHETYFLGSLYLLQLCATLCSVIAVGRRDKSCIDSSAVKCLVVFGADPPVFFLWQSFAGGFPKPNTFEVS